MAKTKTQIVKQVAAELNIPVKEVKMVQRRNAMTGLPFMEAEDTPFYASPRSESYWCN